MLAGLLAGRSWSEREGWDVLVEFRDKLRELAEGEEAAVFGPGGAGGVRDGVITAAEEGNAGGC